MGWNHPTDPAMSAVRYHHLPDVLRPPFIRPLRRALWRFGLGGIAVYRQMQVLLEEIRPDLFDIQMLNAAMIPAALARRGPLVITPWGHDLLVYPQEYSVFTRLAMRWALRRADLVVCNSSRLEQSAIHFGARPQRIRRANWTGVDTKVFRPGIEDSDLRDRYGIVGRPVLFSPRGLWPDYRIHVLIRALPEILRFLPQAQLVISGNPSPFPDYVRSLHTEVEQMGLEGQVIFAGSVPQEQVVQLYALADVVLSVPISDSRPASIFEAMACGVPLIVSDLPSIREIVRDGETGLVVPVDDPAAVAAAVLRLLSDDRLHQHIVERAGAFVREQGDYETEMAKVAQYYAELLER